MPAVVKDGQLQLRLSCAAPWRGAVAAAAAAQGESLSGYAREAIAARMDGRAAIAASERESLARQLGQFRVAARNLNRLVMLAEVLRLRPETPAGAFSGLEAAAATAAITAVERAADAVHVQLRPGAAGRSAARGR